MQWGDEPEQATMKVAAEHHRVMFKAIVVERRQHIG